MTTAEIIRLLSLQPLSREGGYYRETYRAGEIISSNHLPERYTTQKNFGTAIYYLLTPDTCSLLHRLPTDEIYHFYLGDPVTMLQLYPDGLSKVVTLGQALDRGEKLQTIVLRSVWQGSYLRDGGQFALMGTTMAPGFDFHDFETGAREQLIREYPTQKDFIIRLTPGT